MVWGWWQLGRAANLSPIEIAITFEAPTLQGQGLRAEGNILAVKLGRRQLKYSEVVYDSVSDG